MNFSWDSFALLGVFVVVFAIGAFNATSQETQQSPLEASFDTVLAQTTATGQVNGDTLAQWMNANQWQDLPFADQVALLKGLSERSGPYDRFSVRWTGFLTAPSTGSYLLKPHLNEFFSGDLRVWLGDQLVLDSAQPADPDDPAAGFLNTPFEFT
jgi:hypothetical protein